MILIRRGTSVALIKVTPNNIRVCGFPKGYMILDVIIAATFYVQDKVPIMACSTHGTYDL